MFAMGYAVIWDSVIKTESKTFVAYPKWAKLFVDSGTIVITAFISPFTADRDYCREILEDGEFIEIFVDTPIEVCEARDPKGLYKKARSGDIPDFTGIDSEYQAPQSPEITLQYQDESAIDTAERLYQLTCCSRSRLMLNTSQIKALQADVKAVAIAAGNAIMDIYQRDFAYLHQNR